MQLIAFEFTSKIWWKQIVFSLFCWYSQILIGLLDGMTDVGAWVGAHDIRTEAQWIWSDGQPWFDGIKWAYGKLIVRFL